MLAWAADQVAAGQVTDVGALGPLEAFRLETLEAGVAECGIARVGAGTPAAAASPANATAPHPQSA